MLPYGPPGAGAPPMGGGMPGGGMGASPQVGFGGIPKEPIQEAGENVITQLLQMAASNPQLLMGLSMAGAAREVSQLAGLSRRRQGGGAGPDTGRGGAMPTSASLLAGNVGDIDRIMALQQMMGGAAGPPMAAQGTPGMMAAPPTQGPPQSPLLAMLQQGGHGLV